MKFGIETLYTAPSSERLPGPLVEYAYIGNNCEEGWLMIQCAGGPWDRRSS